MLIPEDRIRAALLDPRREIHLQALEYWRGSTPADPSVMPLVIQAADKLGHKAAFSLLRSCQRLPQTEATVGWLMDELDRPLDLDDVAEDNYRFALALILVYADPALLAPRHKAILALRSFPEQLSARLNRRLRLSFLQWPELWHELEEFGLRILKQKTYSADDGLLSDDLVEAMGRMRDGADQIMRAIDLRVPRHQLELQECLLPETIRVAGRMRLRSAIPRIFSLLAEVESDDIAMLDSCEQALISIGFDRVVETIAMQWLESSGDVQLVFAAVLEKIRGEQSLRWAIRLLEEEEDDPDVMSGLGIAALCQFRTEGLAAVNDLLVRIGDIPEEPGYPANEFRDLRYQLLCMCVIAGVEFPELQTHMAQAIQQEFGYYNHEPGRIAENF